MKNHLLKFIYLSLQALVATLAIVLTYITNNPYNYILAFTLIACQLLSTWLLLRRSLVYLKKTTHFFNELAQGKNPKSFEAKGSVFQPVVEAGEKVAIKYKEISNFAHAIGRGDFSVKYKIKNKSDLLGGAMVAMKEQLEKVKKEDDLRNWVNENMDIMHNKIRRIDELDQMSETLSSIIEILGANQGILYTIDKENEKIVSQAVHAYSIKKYLNKEFEISEGLVGQCYLEKGTIELTEIPENYVHITSGLGHATPTYLILVPAKIENEVFGILEIASFKVFKPHEKELLEKFSSQLALNIQGIQINKRTKNLLIEANESKQLLQSQEEELRQNLEELQSSQEAIAEQTLKAEQVTQELNARIGLLNKVMLVSESDIYGNITYVNEKFTEVSGYTLEECLGKPHSILKHPDTPPSLFKEMWETIKSGRTFTAKFQNLSKSGETYWVDATIAPVFDQEGKIEKYINVRADITKNKNLEVELERLKLQAQ